MNGLASAAPRSSATCCTSCQARQWLARRFVGSAESARSGLLSGPATAFGGSVTASAIASTRSPKQERVTGRSSSVSSSVSCRIAATIAYSQKPWSLTIIATAKGCEASYPLPALRFLSPWASSRVETVRSTRGEYMPCGRNFSPVPLVLGEFRDRVELLRHRLMGGGSSPLRLRRTHHRRRVSACVTCQAGLPKSNRWVRCSFCERVRSYRGI